MEEKKLTDEEVVKALECCSKSWDCNNCKRNKENNNRFICSENLLKDCLDLIHRLQENNANQVRMRCDMQRKFDDLQTLCTEQKAENEQLKKDYIELDLECRELRTELDKELAEHEEFTQKAKAEIESLKCDSYRTSWKAKFLEAKAEVERLTEAMSDFRQEVITLNIEKLDLQKQVDELREQLLMAKLQGLNEGYNNGVQAERKAQIFKPTVVELPKEITEQIRGQAVKDTAKEIYDKCIAIDKATGCKGFVCIEAIAELAKSKGVEVE